MKNDPIGIADWSEGLIRNLRAFADHWNAKRETGDPAYPEKIMAGDWDEQFESFLYERARFNGNEWKSSFTPF